MSYRSREETKALIMKAVAQYGGQRVTRLQIARAAGLKKTPYLLELLKELVTAGLLEEIEVYTRPDQKAIGYNLTSKTP